MKRFSGKLRAALGAVLVLLFVAFSTGAEITSPEEVSTWEEAEQFVPSLEEVLLNLWNNTPAVSFTQKTGFAGVFISPEEALATLEKAYADSGDAGESGVLEDWGMPGLSPLGKPARRSLRIVWDGKPLQAETIGFSEEGGWHDNLTLIFLQEGSDWQLIDAVEGEAMEIRHCGDRGLYLECKTIGHGTGFYCRNVSVYNLLTRQVEAGYTEEGFENWYREDFDVTLEARIWGGVSYAADGLHVFCQQTLSSGMDPDRMTVRAEKVGVIQYACGEDGTLSPLER